MRKKWQVFLDKEPGSKHGHAKFWTRKTCQGKIACLCGLRCNNIDPDACDVTLSVYPHRPSLKNMPGHGGKRTYDFWNTCPGIFFKLGRCGYTLRVTSQASYSPECITPTHKKIQYRPWVVIVKAMIAKNGDKVVCRHICL
jgi:hypothetical protein